jgi:hypothetical protein
MYDEVLGPLVSRGAVSYHNYLASKPSTQAALNENIEYSNIINPKEISKEKKILPKVSSPVAARPSTAGGASSSSPSSSSTNPTPKNDFNTSVLTRLADVENDCKLLRRTLAEKVKYIDQLEKDNAALRVLSSQSRTLGGTGSSALMAELRQTKEENIKLLEQINDMKIFLNDYGLVWVGNDVESSMCTAESVDEVQQKAPALDLQHIAPYADFKMKIDELNALICAEPAQVKTETGELTHLLTKPLTHSPTYSLTYSLTHSLCVLAGGSGQSIRAKFVQASEMVENIKIIFYRNGLMIKRGPFRSIDSKSYRVFVTDIMDGYFPSEYREEYPDGVIFDLLDKHLVDYEVGGDEDVKNQMSASNFLARLPKTIVKNGEIIDVRADIKSKLSLNDLAPSKDVESKVVPAKQVTILLETPAKQREDSQERKVATIQVKWTGGNIFQLAMFHDDTVADVKAVISKYLDDNDSKDSRSSFELRTAWPSKALPDDATIESAGLTPKGSLHARILK